MLIGILVAGLVGAGAVAALVMQTRSAPTVAPPQASDVVRIAPRPPVDLVPASSSDSATLVQAEAGLPDDVAHVPDAAMAAAAPSAEPKVAGKGSQQAPARTDPILTKQQAQQVLEPELLSCMRQHGVHYLITRLGNERRGGDVPPLKLTGTTIVDYQPTPGFATTPLGLCVARAGHAVRAPAYGGNYIYFGLRNEAVPDPLSDAPARLDAAAATRALAALDDEARDCAKRHPADSRPGEAVRISVRFGGAGGRVTRVSPFYVEAQSAYGRCLSSVYGKAQIARFKKIEEDVMHVLEP
jgi:hypothetical protein